MMLLSFYNQFPGIFQKIQTKQIVSMVCYVVPRGNQFTFFNVSLTGTTSNIRDLKAVQATLHRSYGKKQRSWELARPKAMTEKSLLWRDIVQLEIS